MFSTTDSKPNSELRRVFDQNDESLQRQLADTIRSTHEQGNALNLIFYGDSSNSSPILNARFPIVGVHTVSAVGVQVDAFLNALMPDNMIAVNSAVLSVAFIPISYYLGGGLYEYRQAKSIKLFYGNTIGTGTLVDLSSGGGGASVNSIFAALNAGAATDITTRLVPAGGGSVTSPFNPTVSGANTALYTADVTDLIALQNSFAIVDSVSNTDYYSQLSWYLSVDIYISRIGRFSAP